MFSVRCPGTARQAAVALSLLGFFLIAGETGLRAGEPDPKDPYLRDPASTAVAEAEMKPYRQRIRHTDVSFEMVPIHGGEFVMGSPDGEADRAEDEGPQHKVRIEPFWMGKCEVTWDEFDLWVEDRTLTQWPYKNRAEARIDIRKSQLETAKRGLDLARKEKREGDRLELERQRGALEVRLRMQEREREVADAALKLAEARREEARALRRVAEQSQRLLDEKEKWRTQVLEDSTRAGRESENVVRQTRRVLEARKDAADRQKTVAERRKDLADRQIQLLEAQQAVSSLEN